MSLRALARSSAVLAALALVAGPLAAGADAAAKRKPPTPSITSKPLSPTNQRTAAFEFTNTQAGVTFECSLDGAAYAACTSPRSYPGPLSEGSHAFKVRARDAAGTLSTAANAGWIIDLTPPAAPTLSGTPSPSPTAATTASFTFSTAELGATFACALDGAAAAPCTSPHALSGLGDGSHTFAVTVRDLAGNTGSPAVAVWQVDVTPPPAPVVTTGPADITNATTASFAVSSPDASATLLCSLDAAAYAACPEPPTYVGLGAGDHTFDVKASDALGNAAAAPTYTWTVDLTAPTPPAILTGPAATTKEPVGSFTFNPFDAVQLKCSLDGAGFADCAASYQTPSLADGQHSLLVKGVDAAANESGSTPYTWTVDNTPPPAATVTGPAALTNATSATFTISNTEQLVTYTCQLDGAAANTCETGVTYNALAPGAHELVVTSSDSLGNATPATFSWTIDTLAPDATAATPTSITAPAVVTFTEAVNGVSAASLALRVSGTTTALASTLACADAATATVPCATGAVKYATLTPAAPLVPGERYSIAANPAGAATIADPAGNKMTVKTFAFRAQTVLQETTPAAAYTWRNVAASSAYGSAYRTEHLAGASATYPFTGTSITWYTVKGRNQGVADVYVDGVKKATVNNYSSATSYKVARTISGLAGAKHLLKIVVRGAKGSTAGTGTYVSIDAVRVGTAAINGTPTLTTAWKRSSVSTASGGTMAVADLAGQEATLRFRGTAISWYTSTGRNRGIVRVYVDGVLKATVDNYATATAYNVKRTITGLSDARHTIRVVVTGTRRAAATGTLLALDRWIVT